MRKRLQVLLFLFGIVVPVAMQAQTTVSGTINDQSGNPLPGVSVKVKGSDLGTMTDGAGKFSLVIPGKSASIEISSIGYKSQTIEISDASPTITIKMLDDVGRLDEVVVTGLASSVKRRNLANAVSLVTSKELVGTTVQPTLDAALYGKVPGSNISANSGAPGGGISMKFRGITSLVGNSQPLFIVDGVYYDNSSIPAGLNVISKAAGQGSSSNQDNPSNRIADLDPEDIERVEVLKGASTAAIYGSRAAAGVVIITTKRGKIGKPVIEVSQSLGMIMQLKKLGQRNWTQAKALAAYGTVGENLFVAANGKTFNYEDELYGNEGLLSTSRLSVSGGNDKTLYYLGYTYKDDEAIVKGTGYRKSSLRINIDQKVTSFLDLSLNTNYVSSKAARGFFNNDNTSTTLGVSFVSTPSWVDLYPDANGNYPNNPLAPSNFIQTRDLITNTENIERILVGGTATLKILNRGKHNLRFIARGGLDQYTLNTIASFPRELQFEKDGNGTDGASMYGTTLSKGTNISAFFVHMLQLNTDLNFTTQLGATGENVNQNTVLNTATQMIGTQTNLDQAGSIQVDQGKTIQKDRGYFIQEEINYADLLLLTLGLRADKSSRNGDANKLYYYPKASAAFNIHKLSSWQMETISQLKLRVAYGQAGNFAPFTALYSPLEPAVFNGSTGSEITLTRGNENLGPEVQKELEAGFDLGLLNDRVSLSFTYYNKEVEDLLLNVAVPSSSGFTTAWKNVAAVENKGFEISLAATPVSSKNWRWYQSTSFWTNDAKVNRLDVPAFNVGAFGATLGTYRIEQGKSPSQIVGIGGPDDKVDPATGLAVYGDGEADFQVGSYHVVTYKNFEFNLMLHWKQGGENINLSTLLSDIFGTSPDFDDKGVDPTGAKVNGDYRLGALGTTARPWVENASYFRVREIGLSYLMPREWFKNVAQLKLSLSGRNIINIFDYNSYDPEVSNFGSNAVSSNVEVAPYPSSKSVYFKITATF
ncbi:MAG TPA: SusC/RagA family TonB-linked outer membrane protein [Chitinophagaceae bacterium]|nr:SusC/RagA family TonB-linked outer membrane protein [Chitinophagaceae bacterium]